MKRSRSLSFIIILFVYILASGLGVVCYNLLPFDFWLSLLISDVLATIIVFIFSLIFKNASTYDPYWSVAPIVIVLAYTINKELNISRLLVLIAILIWGIRLTINWAYTFHGLLHEDWRYCMLREKCGKFYPIINFVGIHLVPTLVVYAALLPAVFMFNYEVDFNFGVILGFLLSILAVFLQGVSDIWMHSYRKKKKEGLINNSFINVGLWKYSRHPNYLGEILMWFGIGIIGLALLPNFWFLIFGAVVNLCLFLFVSIPLADNKQAKKEGFNEYKNKTRMLLPLPKKLSR